MEMVPFLSNRLPNTICLVVLCAIALSGMAFASDEPQKAHVASLRHDARVDLEMATSAVAAAARARVLWIPARDALERARHAFAEGRFKETIDEAQRARQFAELGLEQAHAPPYRNQ